MNLKETLVCLDRELQKWEMSRNELYTVKSVDKPTELYDWTQLRIQRLIGYNLKIAYECVEKVIKDIDLSNEITQLNENYGTDKCVPYKK